MNSTFSRAVIGFLVMTVCLLGLSFISLSAIAAYANGYWLANIIVIVVAMITQISIYLTTLHDPVYHWIREPAKKKEMAERQARSDMRSSR